MALAKSYKPVLTCIAKVSILTGFHVVFGFILLPVERWGVVCAILVVDRWVAREFILDSNACVSIIMVSLLAHELRDAGVQTRAHDSHVSSLFLSALVLSNLLITAFGENWCINTSPSLLLGPDNNSKRFRIPYQSHTSRKEEHSCGYIHTQGILGSLICLVTTCGLLVLISTCTEEGGPQDLYLTNLRVFFFTGLSLTWFYTVEYRSLGYNSVSQFTPCLLRFSSVLYLPSHLLTIGVVSLLAACITTTYFRSMKGPIPSVIIPPPIDTPPVLQSNKPNTVVRASSNVVSYRVPAAQKLATLQKQTIQENSASGAGLLLSIQSEGGETPINGDVPSLDYEYLFEQASLTHSE